MRDSLADNCQLSTVNCQLTDDYLTVKSALEFF
jgi:hypothetical protein